MKWECQETSFSKDRGGVKKEKKIEKKMSGRRRIATKRSKGLGLATQKPGHCKTGMGRGGGGGLRAKKNGIKREKTKKRSGTRRKTNRTFTWLNDPESKKRREMGGKAGPGEEGVKPDVDREN